jgi:adenylate cyclase
MSTQKNKKIAALAILFVLLTIICSAIAWLNPLDKLQLQFSNFLYYERPTNHPIVIVAIDDKSLSDDQGLGRFQDWSRDYYAQVIGNLQKYQPASIGLDIFFRSRSQGIKQEKLQEILQSPNIVQTLQEYSSNNENIHPEDRQLIEQLKLNDNIVLASLVAIPSDAKNLLEIIEIPTLNLPNPIFNIDNAAFISNILDSTGLVRSIIPKVFGNENGTESFSLINAANYLKLNNALDYQLNDNQLKITFANGEIKIPLENYQLLINFTSKVINRSEQLLKNENLKILSFVDVYDENYPATFDPNYLKDKIVLIGAYADSLDDNFITPIEPKTAMPGVLIHAQAIQTILDQAFLRNTSLPELIALIAFFIALALAATFQLKIRYAIPLLAAIGLSYTLLLAPPRLPLYRLDSQPRLPAARPSRSHPRRLYLSLPHRIQTEKFLTLCFL